MDKNYIDALPLFDTTLLRKKVKQPYNAAQDHNVTNLC